MDYLRDHGYVLDIYGFIPVHRYKCPVLVIELAPYGSLATILYNRDLDIPKPLLVSWLLDISNAVKYIHSKKVKHLDIKCENFLLTEGLRLKVGDFGLAKKQSPSAKTSILGNFGTNAFAAPELRNGESSQFASDIYSIALTAVQLLSREIPKSGLEEIQIMTSVDSLQAPDFSDREDFYQLLCSCIQYEQYSDSSLLNDLRPDINSLVKMVASAIKKMGGDPREKNSVNAKNDCGNYVRKIEQILRTESQQRLGATGFLDQKLDHQKRIEAYVYFSKSTDVSFFVDMTIVEAWRNRDPQFHVFVAYQKYFKLNGKFPENFIADFAKPELTLADFKDCYAAFDRSRLFVRLLKDQTKENDNNEYWFSKDELVRITRISKPQMAKFLDIIQHCDKVNCNLGPYYSDPEKTIKSTWDNSPHKTCRPGFYEWAEKVYGFVSDSATAFSADDQPVRYPQTV
jgi:hypothetical protein